MIDFTRLNDEALNEYYHCALSKLATINDKSIQLNILTVLSNTINELEIENYFDGKFEDSIGFDI
jgi:hypothetical protein